jgi:hypothetical protein
MVGLTKDTPVCGVPLKWFVLILLTLQNAGAVVLMRYKMWPCHMLHLNHQPICVFHLQSKGTLAALKVNQSLAHKLLSSYKSSSRGSLLVVSCYSLRDLSQACGRSRMRR